MEDQRQKKTNIRKVKFEMRIFLGSLFVFMIGALVFFAIFPQYYTFFRAGFFIDKKLLSYKKNPLITVSDNINSVRCDVIVVGGGMGGTAAAIQAARDGAFTCLLEETDWLGGAMTAGGVSSVDGNDWNYTGLFAEFIRKVEKKYPNHWTQNHLCLAPFCFEPSVGRDVLDEMAKAEPNLYVYFNTKLKNVVRKKNKIKGIIATIATDRTVFFNAPVTIEATELGDVLYLGNVPHDLGPEKTNELHSGNISNCIQPITALALIYDTGSPQKPIAKPKGYDPQKYYCTIPSSKCPNSNTEFRNWEFFLKYGQLPYGKIMVNVPSHSYGNDNPVDRPEFDPLTREEVIELSKNNTRGLIYFFQTELKKSSYQIYNEFGTVDGLAIIPYVRESRRVIGVSRIMEEDVIADSKTGKTRFWEDAIAVGDYPLDIHSCQRGKRDIFLSQPPFQVPYSALIPKEVDGLIVAEKNISVSHIANGRTRLQPIVFSIGQAAGAAAAIALEDKIEPREVNIQKLQKKLIEAKSRINFYFDVPPDHWAFPSISLLSQEGIASGYDKNNFGVNNALVRSELAALLIRTFGQAKDTIKRDEFQFRDVAPAAWFSQFIYKLPKNLIKNNNIFTKNNFQPVKPVTRGEMAEWLVTHLNLELPKALHAAPVYFYDLPDKHPAKKAIDILSSYQVIRGSKGACFPNAILSRAEAMEIIYRIQKVEEGNRGKISNFE